MSNARHRPYVLIVDDYPEEVAQDIASELTKRNVATEVLHPEDVELSHLRRADVLLVDYELQNWTQLGVPTSNYCSSGWSLAAVLKDRCRSVDVRSSTTITALLTSQIDAATLPFTTAGREHVSASLNGIEWVFDKTDAGLAGAIVALANGSLKVRRNWGLGDIFSALGVSEDEVAKRDDVIRCRPPLSESLTWQDGLGFVRWLLHWIIPYPTFLVDEHYLAARMGVPVQEISRLIGGRSSLAKKIKAERYKGVFCDFAQPRWWRIGLEKVFWEVTEGKPGDIRLLRKALEKSAKTSFQFIDGDTANFVTCYDELLRPRDLPADAADAVRIWPDDWPQFASQPWALKNDVEDSENLQRIAIPFGA